MMLLVDAGNTRLKWALWQAGEWRQRGVWANEALPVGVETWQGVQQAVICHVGPPQVKAWLQQQLVGVPQQWVTAPPAGWGVCNGYTDPAQLGADRWATLVAVRSKTTAPALVVNAGTAVTIDALTADGHFIGGLIVPGLTAMRQALLQRAPHLSSAAGQWRAFPDNTQDALHSGALQALVGAITLQWQALARLSGDTPVCYLAGGDAASLLPHLQTLPLQLEEDLVLQGLLQMSELEF